MVRYTAGEVRKRLQLYYSETSRTSQIRISLPAGSYIPEFLHEQDEPDVAGDDASSRVVHSPEADSVSPTSVESPEPRPASHTDAGVTSTLPAARTIAIQKRLVWLALTAILVIAIVAGVRWNSRAVYLRTAVDDFWEPVLRDQHTIVICTGSVVFAQNSFTGVHTAGKDIDYPFVSLQNASAIAQLSGRLESSGVTTRLVTSATVPLTDLREHSVMLVGGYNNQWTLRLLEPLRFHFSPDSIESPDEIRTIADRLQPQMHWERDHTLPYSNADDYALLARFRDATTDGWVVAVAGLGRNGTEAAAQFATSPHYMQLLRDQAGRDFSSHNIEAVLKVNVIDGKTGAPTILAVHVW